METIKVETKTKKTNRKRKQRLWGRTCLPLCIPQQFLTLLEPQSAFGDKLLNFQVVCPQNGTAVLKGLTISDDPGRVFYQILDIRKFTFFMVGLIFELTTDDPCPAYRRHLLSYY